MNISQNAGIESAKLTYSINGLMNRHFPNKIGDDLPVDSSTWTQNATPEQDETAPPPKLGRYINVWA